MKQILLSRVFLLCSCISIVLGYLIGRDIGSDFYNLYIGKLGQLPYRYIMLSLILFLSYFLCSSIFKPSIIVRNHDYFNVFLKELVSELELFVLLFFFVHIPIYICNHIMFIEYLGYIIMIIFNSVLISLFISTLVKLIDMLLKNRILSSCIFFMFFSLVDLLLEHFNFYIVENITFDFSYIFTLPAYYNHYLIIALFMILINVLLISLVMNIAFRKDYFLRNEN